jgi:inorganic triphosphatase YgiF
VQVEGLEPEAWTDSPARVLALQISDGRPLFELVALDQVRYLHWLYADAVDSTRCVAELSLDRVSLASQSEAGKRSYFELEIELQSQGAEEDLRILVSHLRNTWGLKPEPRSKFERAIALVD